MSARPSVCTVIGEQKIRSKIAPGARRILSDDEAEPTFSHNEAVEEAKRCTVSSPCFYCDVCQLMCPDLAITRDKQTGQIIIDLDYCKGCGLCAHYCPRGAIKMIVDDD